MTVARMEGTMEGWWAPNTLSDTAIGAHWLTFLALLACTVFLAYESFAAKGPSGREKFFAGYHEQYNLALYVNLMASLSYFAKVVSDTHGHNFENVGPFIIGLGNYKYADYMLTCPLLVMDLLFQLRAPYKVTGAVLIFAVLFCGAITNFYPGKENQQAALAWFGMGVFYYCLSYFFLGYIVSRQYRRLEEMAMGTEAKKALGPLRLAITVFFTIWVAFPAVWIVSDRGFNVIDASTAEVLHCIADLIAKSLYGFALARFRRYYDKKMFEILENLGYDGEEAIEELENEMRHMDKEEELEKQAV
nr:protein 107 [synthetic construct]